MADPVETASSPFRLVILGDGSVRTIPLVGDRWVIGRAPDCEITLRDPTVSRRHVLLERRGEEFRVQDLGGRNPVLVDGRPQSSATLAAGETVSIGMTRLVLEQRVEPKQVESSPETVVITGREVIDDELQEGDRESAAARARRVLERIEWTFADLGSLADAAEPLLGMALNLTGRQRGLLAQFSQTGGLDTLAAFDVADRSRSFVVPEGLLHETRRLNQVTMLTTASGEGSLARLVIPLGIGPEAILLLEDPLPTAPAGQELLRLARSIGKVVWHRLLEVRERLNLRDEVERLRFHGSSAHNAVLTSCRLQGARQHLRELANADGAVLLVGEEGTEREDLARYLHAEGNRRQNAFVSVHLGLLPEWRFEKELFGEDRRTTGAFGRARDGTLFLDGIHLLPVHLQKRVSGAMRPADSGLAGNARLVCSAEKTPDAGSPEWAPALAELLEAHVVRIPPLREEPPDVISLAELFLSDMGSAPDGSPRLLSERAKRILVGHSWPGNVRQLRQVLESAAAQAGNQQILPRHLPPDVTDAAQNAEDSVSSLEEVERRHIRETLKRLGGNRARTAQALGIATSTLYEKLRRYGIEG